MIDLAPPLELAPLSNKRPPPLSRIFLLSAPLE